MPRDSISETYRGYEIIATSNFCEVLSDNTRVDRFVREYLRMDVPEGLAMALLIDEAKERVDVIVSAAERPLRVPERHHRMTKRLVR